MTWNDFYRRQHAIRALLEHAEHHPDQPLPAVPEQFANLDELLAALQYTWTRALNGRVEVAAADAEETDRVQAVTDAWHRTRASSPVLRAVLDRHLAEPGPLLRRARIPEWRLLALAAGLADHNESDEFVIRVGKAFQSLLCSTPKPEPAPLTGPIAQLRRLIPSI